MKLDTEQILADFLDTLPDFCDTCIPNGSRRGNEWDCSDIFNSELEEGDRGSCGINLRTGCFKDQNQSAEVQKGGPYTLFSAITGLKGAKAYQAMQQWNTDRTLPDGTKGVASGKRVELSEGVTIEAEGDFEMDRVKWIGVFRTWKEYAIKEGLKKPSGCIMRNGDGTLVDYSPEAEAKYIAKETRTNDNRIAWAVSDIYARRWQQAVEFTQDPIIREKFAGELAEMRGLSKEVFYWLIDNDYIACVYERKEIPQPAMTTDEGEYEEPPPIVREYFNIAFPVYREVTAADKIPQWAGGRDFIDPSNPHWGAREEMKKRGEPSVLFHGMHIPWTDRDGHKHWRYVPKGLCPSLPWIVGDVAKADLVVIAESTWDIIAYLDLRQLYKWKRPWCAIGTRGAGGAQRISADQIKDGAVVLRLLQNDAANSAWVNSLPAIPQAEHREIQPPPEDKDLNDWIRRIGADGVYQSLYKKP